MTILRSWLIQALKLAAAIFLGAAAVDAATYTVTNVNDSGAGSLRQAITSANANAGDDSITFAIGTGAKSIALLSPLPAITDGLALDATTQPGYVNTPIIELNGTSAGAGASGLELRGGNILVRGLIINRFGNHGILVYYTAAGRPEIYNCWIGVNSLGGVASANGGDGIHVANAATIYIGFKDTSLVNRNLISGNTGAGIHLADHGGTSYLYNNHIGLNFSGTLKVPNEGDGVYVDKKDVFIGKAESGYANVISGNDRNGIRYADSTSPRSNNWIIGNKIGTNPGGTAVLGNTFHGVFVGTKVNVDFGAVDNSNFGNIIGGNGFTGVTLKEDNSMDMYDNFIGTNSVGADLGNGLAGVRISSGYRISIFRSTIAHNGTQGIHIDANTYTTKIWYCNIGTTSTGANIGNGSSGIIYNSTYVDNFLDIATNKIAFNGGDGINIISANDMRSIFNNEIWANTGLGIDLFGDGVTANDALDADNITNFPVITAATTTRVAMSLNGKPGTEYELHLYAAEPDPTGHGEGRTYLTQDLFTPVKVTTNQGGNASYTFTGLNLAAGTSVTALAVISGNTFYRCSEFSQNAVVSAADTGDFGMVSAAVSVSEGAATAAVTVNRTGGSLGAAGVSYVTSAGTATAGVDFTSTNGILNFANGQTSATINVPILADAFDESDETFTVTLSFPTGGPQITGAASTTVTIVDNDNPPSLSIADVSQTEGNLGTSPFLFTVNLSTPSNLSVSVNWSTADVTANGSSDFAASTGTLSFAAGETSKQIAITVLGDNLPELSETFHVNLSMPVNATIADGTGLGTITDDDTPGEISFASATYSAQENELSKALVIQRTGGSTGTVTVNYAVTGGSAVVGQDYPSGQSGTIQLLNGQTSANLTFSFINDNVQEIDDTVEITLSAPTGGATLGSQASTTLTIVNDDVALSISGRVLRQDNSLAMSGVTVTLSGAASAQTTTNGSGIYQFSGLVSGENYSVTVAQADFTFAPASRSYTPLTTTVGNESFEGIAIEDPKLTLTHNGNGTVTLEWPVSAVGWVLQSSPNLQANSWQNVTLPPVLPSGPMFFYQLPAPLGKNFYRLARP